MKVETPVATLLLLVALASVLSIGVCASITESSDTCGIAMEDKNDKESCRHAKNQSHGGPTLMKSSEAILSQRTSLYDIPLKRIVFHDNNHDVTESEDTMTFRDVTKHESNLHHNGGVSIVFVVRRPGCVLCREHGQQLMDWYDHYKNKDMVNMWGIIKEFHVDDVGLYQFYSQYYKYPLYHDIDLAFYKAFGNRSIFHFKTWNPLTLYRGFMSLKDRLSEKSHLVGNYKGEGTIQGGLFLVDANGDIQYAYEEDIGNELNIPQIEDAIEGLISSRQQ